MSRVREFERESMIYGEDRVAGIKLSCGKCQTTETLPRGSSKTYVGPAEESARFAAMFARKGWNVGKRKQDDRCPDCMKKLGATPPGPTVMETKMQEALAAQGLPAGQAVPAPQADKPREMSPSDGRLIMLKLDDAYDLDKKGYKPGWTDNVVAQDMGVPRGWVENVRKQFFGPEGSNPDVDAVLADARHHLAQARKLIHGALEAQNTLNKDLATMKSQAELIQRRIDRIEQQVGR